MIKKTNEDFAQSGESSIEQYLRTNENKLKKEYALGDLLFYLNIVELLKGHKVDSEYFNQKLKVAHENN